LLHDFLCQERKTYFFSFSFKIFKLKMTKEKMSGFFKRNKLSKIYFLLICWVTTLSKFALFFTGSNMLNVYNTKIPSPTMKLVPFCLFESTHKTLRLEMFQRYIIGRYFYLPYDLPIKFLREKHPNYALYQECIDRMECDQHFCELLMAVNAYFDY